MAAHCFSFQFPKNVLDYNPYNFQSKIWNCNIYQSGKKTVKKDKPDSPPPIFS